MFMTLITMMLHMSRLLGLRAILWMLNKLLVSECQCRWDPCKCINSTLNPLLCRLRLYLAQAMWRFLPSWLTLTLVLMDTLRTSCVPKVNPIGYQILDRSPMEWRKGSPSNNRL